MGVPHERVSPAGQGAVAWMPAQLCPNQPCRCLPSSTDQLSALASCHSPPQALQHVMEGCGEAFRPHLDDSLRRLIYRALAHPNRFIRCAGGLGRNHSVHTAQQVSVYCCCCRLARPVGHIAHHPHLYSCLPPTARPATSWGQCQTKLSTAGSIALPDEIAPTVCHDPPQ